MIFSDKKLAEKSLKKASNLEPGEPQWSDQLGLLYSLQSKADSATHALAAFEKAQAVEQEDIFKFYRLDKLAKAAFKAGEFEKASLYANELLKAATHFPKDWNYGNAIQHGNNILGRIALKQGDLELASDGVSLWRREITPSAGGRIKCGQRRNREGWRKACDDATRKTQYMACDCTSEGGR